MSALFHQTHLSVEKFKIPNDVLLFVLENQHTKVRCNQCAPLYQGGYVLRISNTTLYSKYANEGSQFIFLRNEKPEAMQIEKVNIWDKLSNFT